MVFKFLGIEGSNPSFSVIYDRLVRSQALFRQTEVFKRSKKRINIQNELGYLFIRLLFCIRLSINHRQLASRFNFPYKFVTCDLPIDNLFDQANFVCRF